MFEEREERGRDGSDYKTLNATSKLTSNKQQPRYSHMIWR
jgi:hypothetical protein